MLCPDALLPLPRLPFPPPPQIDYAELKRAAAARASAAAAPPPAPSSRCDAPRYLAALRACSSLLYARLRCIRLRCIVIQRLVACPSPDLRSAWEERLQSPPPCRQKGLAAALCVHDSLLISALSSKWAPAGPPHLQLRASAHRPHRPPRLLEALLRTSRSPSSSRRTSRRLRLPRRLSWSSHRRSRRWLRPRRKHQRRRRRHRSPQPLLQRRLLLRPPLRLLPTWLRTCRGRFKP